MIEQVMGHRSFKWLEQNDSCHIINFIHHPNFPETTKVLENEFEERLKTRGNNISYHYPEVVNTFPEPNNSMPMLESSPHIWHFRDDETEIEFLMFSDGLRKNHYKGTRVEVLYDENEYHEEDNKLAHAYNRLLEFVEQCYNDSLKNGNITNE